MKFFIASCIGGSQVISLLSVLSALVQQESLCHCRCLNTQLSPLATAPAGVWEFGVVTEPQHSMSRVW